MKIETIKAPETVKELTKLLKDEHIFVVFNSYPYLCDIWAKSGREIDFEYKECYRIRPLSTWIKDTTDLNKMNACIYSLESNNRRLIRIEE